jgi:hypothetical protein
MPLCRANIRAIALLVLLFPPCMFLYGVRNFMADDRGELCLVLDDVKHSGMNHDDTVRQSKGIWHFLLDDEKAEWNPRRIARRQLSLAAAGLAVSIGHTYVEPYAGSDRDCSFRSPRISAFGTSVS